MKLHMITLGFSKTESLYLASMSKMHFSYNNFFEIENLETYISGINGKIVVVINYQPESKKSFEQQEELIILNFAKSLQIHDNINVILLANDTGTEDRVFWTIYTNALYILRPLDLLEVFYTTKRLLQTSTLSTIISDNNFYIDIVKREILYHDHPLKLGPKLFELIVYFVSNPGRVISRNELLSNVFKINDYLDDRSIDTNIKKIRKKTNYELLDTIRGQGYLYNDIKR
ncbi:MAG: winged helix-turn-helix domain-containing protein [Bacilli bacterium]